MAIHRRDWALLLVGCTFLAGARAGTVTEADPYWQARAGMESLAGAPLVRSDTWSWAPVDNGFAQTSPLWSIALGSVFQGMGFVGMFLLAFFSIASLLAVSAALSHRLGADPLPTLAAFAIVLLPVLAMLSPRATVVAQTMFLCALLGVDSARRRTPHVAVEAISITIAFAAIVGLGSWLHLSWLLLAPALVVSTGALWLTAGFGFPRALLRIFATAAGAWIGLLSGPYGISGAWSYSRSVEAACRGLITEWMSPFTSGLALRWAPVAVLAAVLLALVSIPTLRRLVGNPRDAHASLSASLLLLAAPATVGGFVAIRFLGVAAFALLPVVAALASEAARRWGQRATERPPRGPFRSRRVRFWSESSRWRIVVTLVLAVLSPGAVLLAVALSRPAIAPVVASLPPGCRLFSDPGSAGPVILLRPDVKVWVDTRADYWGRARLVETQRILSDGDPTIGPLGRATCVVIDRSAGGTTLARRLDSAEGWTRGASRGDVLSWVRSTS